MRRLLVTLLLSVFCAAPAAAGELIVSAAASLTNAFRDIGAQFEAVHPGDKVTFNFAASDVLVSQIVNGAPADVLVSADQEAMDRAEKQGVLASGSRRVLLSNSLVLIVPLDSKAQLAGLIDLQAPAIRRIAIGDPASVPAGRYAREALQQANLWSVLEPRMVLALNVRQCLDYVARGEVDAGLVYATDAAIMPNSVRVVATVPTRTPIVYPLALVTGSRNRALADAFVAFLTTEAARAALARHGFGKP